MSSLLQATILFLVSSVPTLAHNYVVCTNAPNVPLDDLLNDRHTKSQDELKGNCSGYPRAWPADGTGPPGDNRNDQGWPWQNIWPLHDQAVLKNHRVCNWNQENPTYAPGYGPARVKPGSTLMMQVQTNNHIHEYKDRPSGHYKIFLAGPSGTQLTTANQLTFDRVIFSAPSNKYAHVVGDPTSGAEDPQFAYLPVKMVDPSGSYLPEGTYNFVWAWFWASGSPPQKDFMIPAYSTSFDVILDSASDDAGSLTECATSNPDCTTYLVGKTESPGAKDTTSPWPPYEGNYLFTNYDGDDPSTDNGKRTFQPYWQDFVPASEAPAVTEQAPFNIKEKSEDFLLAPLPVAGAAPFPPEMDQYPFMLASAGDSIPVTQVLKPMKIDGSTEKGGNATMMTGDGQTATQTTVEASPTETTTSTSGCTSPTEETSPEDGTTGGDIATEKKARRRGKGRRHRQGHHYVKMVAN